MSFVIKKQQKKPNLPLFILFFSAIFLASFTILFSLGLIPSELNPKGSNTFLGNLRKDTLEGISNISGNSFNDINEVLEEPVSIYIPSVNVKSVISNPKTKNVVVLDEYLKQGVVRYVDSGLLGKGNMLLFGHSASNAVSNPALRAFNGIKNLKKGEEIYIDSEGFRYVYTVDSVRLVNAETELIDFSKNENMVTLSTCNTFGKKQERHVVEAYFDRKEKIENI